MASELFNKREYHRSQPRMLLIVNPRAESQRSK